MNDSKKPEQTVITKEEWQTRQLAAHLTSDDSDIVHEPSIVSPRPPHKVTVLNPFKLRASSGPIIEGEAKPETKE
jgi:hypothetical protein